MGDINTSPFLAVGFCYSDTTLKTLTSILVVNTNCVWNSDPSKVRQAFHIDKMKALLKAKPDAISNLELSMDTIKTTNGTMQRYPTYVGDFSTKNLVKNALVVIGAIESVGYRMLDVTAGFKDLSNDTAVLACSAVDIANGKLVTNNGKTIISSISGTYPNIPIVQSKIAEDRGVTSTQSMDTKQALAKKKERIEEAQKRFKEKARQAAGTHNASSDELNTPEVQEALAKRDIVEEDRQFMKELQENIKAKGVTNSFSMRLPIVSGITSHSESHLHDVIGVVKEENQTDMTRRAPEITIEKKLSGALYTIQNVFPFYSTVITNLGLEELPMDHPCQTMCVSPNKMFWHPNFIRDTSLPALTFVFLHECCHVLMRHHSRQGARDTELWNIATDLYINKSLADELGIKSAGVAQVFKGSGDTKSAKTAHVEIPNDVLYNSSVDLAKDTAESIYEELFQSLQQQMQNSQGQGDGEGEGQGQGDGQNGEQSDGQGQGQGSGNSSSVTFRGTKIPYKSSGKGKMAQNDIVHDTDSSKLSHDQLAKNQLNKAKSIVSGFKMRGGHTDSVAAREIDDIMTAEHRLVNWKAVLRRFLSAASGYENTFARPDRRHISSGNYLPGRTKVDPDMIENLKVCVDTSGSMSIADETEMLATIADIFKVYKAKAELLYWDTEIRAVYDFDDVKSLIEAKPAGGGGTDPACIFHYFDTNPDYVRRKKHKPSLIIVLTDGYIGNVDKKYMPKYGKNTLWILTSSGIPDFDPPFGKMATYKDQF